MLDRLSALAQSFWICVKAPAARLQVDARAPILESAALALVATKSLSVGQLISKEEKPYQYAD
jgi:hypothetical protein